MPIEHSLKIDFHITQEGLDLKGQQEITKSSEMQVDISQQGMHLIDSENIYPSLNDYIVFDKWFKGDKGDKGDRGIKGDKGDKGDPGTALYGTTEYWNSRVGYIPPKGAIIVYSDYSTIEIGGENVSVPGIKIGSGNGYVQDLVFVSQDTADDLLAHINNTTVHITDAEREFWNGKINVNDSMETVEETLIFNRN